MRQDVVAYASWRILCFKSSLIGRQNPRDDRAFPMCLYGKTFGASVPSRYICTIKFNLTPTVMKKITSMLAMLLIAMATVTLTSCTEDEEIANTLWGIWKGDMGMYYDYGGNEYDASYTVLAFDKDPYTYSSGSGYWIDYYSNGSYSYYATNISWSVYNGVIQIYSVEDGENWYISEYSLNYDRFSGILQSDYSEPMSFNLYKTSAPNWSDYDWNGWHSSGYYGYYNTKQQSRSAVAANVKPVRKIRGNTNK